MPIRQIEYPGGRQEFVSQEKYEELMEKEIDFRTLRKTEVYGDHERK